MKLVTGILGILLSTFCHGQCEKNINLDTNIFNRGVGTKIDTINFKAKLIGIGKISQRDILQKLNSRKFIDIKNYKMAIGFIPKKTNCLLYLPYKNADEYTNKLLYYKQNQNQTICIRGITIPEFEKFNNKPFFLIDKIWFE